MRAALIGGTEEQRATLLARGALEVELMQDDVLSLSALQRATHTVVQIKPGMTAASAVTAGIAMGFATALARPVCMIGAARPNGPRNVRHFRSWDHFLQALAAILDSDAWWESVEAD